MISFRASRWLSVLAVFFVATPGFAQSAPTSDSTLPGGDVCITVNEARDTLSVRDRTSAVLLLTREFEREGHRVVSSNCATPYTVSHVRLGDTIIVTLKGAEESREGAALGLNDLPALYSQMVRSMVTGKPMTSFKVVDRTNVTAAQSAQARIQSESFKYVRLGYGNIFGDQNYRGPAMGFGYRVEFDSLGVDVSFFNFQFKPRGGHNTSGATVMSLLKLEGLYFMNPRGNTTAYMGGGFSYGVTDAGGSRGIWGSQLGGRWHGSGLQGELTVGYEFPRASSVRMFVQADATLPFYKARWETYSATNQTFLTADRYVPALSVSIGFGWQRNPRRD